MQIGKRCTDVRARIVDIIRTARANGKIRNDELKRPRVWAPVMCSNYTDCEQIVIHSGFDPRDIASWAALADANPNIEYQCFVSHETDEYGDSPTRIELMVRVPADDRQWLDHLVDDCMLGWGGESTAVQIYRKLGVYLNDQQIAEIVKIAGEYE